MRVLYIYSLILKRQRGLMEISIAQLSEYLPALWDHAHEDHLLRGAIISLLLGNLRKPEHLENYCSGNLSYMQFIAKFISYNLSYSPILSQF